ncbi:MAG: tagaturonate reductase [Bacillota bacterium]|uniref:tagaturonate reductase n=1 Tax=Desulfurispora thermophila TaxID=265470 RepID=UPI000361A424|nr:tagaturonate reductase [Desulfurispora thermophila]
MRLQKALLSSDFQFPPDLNVPVWQDYPEKILQFGEGNFMRAFVNWMVHHLNLAGLFGGKAVVVQPIPQGLVDVLNEQDGLYTLLLRGLQSGQVVEEKQIVSSISRGLNPYQDWSAYLKCAENPSLRFVISNTTEAGIVYEPEEYNPSSCPKTFPAKLLHFLYHRYCYFRGTTEAGMVIIPCELIERNGDKLKQVLLTLLDHWSLPGDFRDWLVNCNYFLNTLVDRIVTGYPAEQAAQIQQWLGYEDKLLNTGEIFHLWVIEGPEHLAEELPFHKIGLNVQWVSDVTPYRDRKVYILNGSHTMTVPIAFLCGLDTVREAVEHPLLGEFLRRGIFTEIVPVLELPEEEKNSFANSVLERFANPYIKHRLLDIALNSTSKYITRCWPVVKAYYHRFGQLPQHLTFAMAALLALYRGQEITNGCLVGRREKGSYQLKDDLNTLHIMLQAWQKTDPDNPQQVAETVRQLLTDQAIWGTNLGEIPEFPSAVAQYLHAILSRGPLSALSALLQK